jgi:oxygen-dependent protoporphyrinogen oxidase
MTRVVIAGAGIAGLSIAHALAREVPDAEVVVLEARDRVGGNIRSERVEGYLCEWAADGFLDNAPATLALAAELGLNPRVLPSSDRARRRFIYRSGRLHEVPLSPAGFLKSRLLSVRGKVRVASEPFVRPRPAHDETIHEFAERHIGREAAEIMVGSMVSGIFAGDAHVLSLRACFPKMWEMENEYRSLFRALVARRRERRSDAGIGSPAGRLTSFVDGMEELVLRLEASLGSAIRTSSPIAALRARGVRTGPGPRPVGARAFSVIADGRPIEADVVVLAGPASESADLVRPFDTALAQALAGIPTAPLAVVCLGYDEAALTADRGPLDGFGFLVPRGEGPRILGALWETSIYEGRAPAGKALLRVMIGGATDPDVVDVPEADLIRIVRDDLERTMDLRIAPEFVRVIRHRRGIPQYTAGHVARLNRIDTLLKAHPGLLLAGNSYRGVSINACIAEAPSVAARIADHLRTRALAEEEFSAAR